MARSPKFRKSARDEESPKSELHRLETGRVVRVDARMCRVKSGDEVLDCRVRGHLFNEEKKFTRPVAVGDVVKFSRSPTPVVEFVEPRRNVWARPQFYRTGLQAIAVNLDQAVLVVSWSQPDMNLRLLDRHLVFCLLNEIDALIVINKIDLCGDLALYESVQAIYSDIGYRVLATSVLRHQGIEDLKLTLKDKVSVFCGMSGVGKSALLSAIEPGLLLRSAAVSSLTGKGRHTTTAVNLLDLSGGGHLVDTPGMREFGLDSLDGHELSRGFVEFLPFLDACRYRRCSHTHEIPCAVKDAVTEGKIHPARYDSFVRLAASPNE